MLPSRLRPLTLLLGLAIAVLAACSLSQTAHARKARPQLEYRVELPQPHRQYVHITLRVGSPGSRALDLAMPAWTPGSYLVRDYAKHVYDVRATTDSGRPLPVTRRDKQTWRVEHGGRDFVVQYRVFAAEASVRASHVDDRHASLIGASLYMYPVGHRDRASTLKVVLPEGWSAHTALPPATARASDGEAWFAVADYDTLVDSPIELGTPAMRQFVVDETHYDYVVTGAEGTAIDIDRLARDAEAVVAAQAELMGGLPLSRYVFLLRVSPRGGGGLEHHASTSMMMRRSAFDQERGYRSAARLAGHEHFHLWNVKRLHDRVLGPFDYRGENHSRLLWFHEGFTETMEAQGLLHAGLLTPREYLDDLGTRWTRYLKKPGRDRVSIAQVSFDAWIRAYQPQQNHANVSISYYEKGEYIGIALDLELRLRSASHGHAGSLPGLFRRLMASHGADDRGLTMDDIVAAASAEAGEPMQWFFDAYVEGTKPLPLPQILARAGIDVSTTAPWLDDQGQEKKTLTDNERRARVYSGLSIGSGGSVRNVVPGSPADAAGLMRGDEVLAIGGRRADDTAIARTRLSDHDPGHAIVIAVFRDGRLIERTLTLQQSPHRTVRFSIDPKADIEPSVAAVRDGWLPDKAP